MGTCTKYFLEITTLFQSLEGFLVDGNISIIGDTNSDIEFQSLEGFLVDGYNIRLSICPEF